MNTNCDKKQSPRLLTATDAGFTYTVATLSILAISFVFSLVIILLSLASGTTTEAYIKELENSFAYKLVSYGLSGVALFIAVMAVSLYVKQKPFTPLPFKRTEYKYWIIAAMLTFGLLFGFNELNNLFISLLEKFGYSSPAMDLPNEEWWQYIIWIIVACALPAFFEEVIFRGYILEGLKGFSTPFIVIVGGVLFSLFHQNPQQTPYQFICGAVYFLFAIKCGSLLPCMAMHFANNFIIITSDFISGGEFHPTVTLVLTVTGLICFALAVIYLIFFDKKPSYKADFSSKDPINHTKTRFFIMAGVGVAACLTVWISNLFA